MVDGIVVNAARTRLGNVSVEVAVRVAAGGVAARTPASRDAVQLTFNLASPITRPFGVFVVPRYASLHYTEWTMPMDGRAIRRERGRPDLAVAQLPRRVLCLRTVWRRPVLVFLSPARFTCDLGRSGASRPTTSTRASRTSIKRISGRTPGFLAASRRLAQAGLRSVA